MKTVKITVTQECGGTQEIEITFESDIMPDELHEFIVAHIGGRPTDR